MDIKVVKILRCKLLNIIDFSSLLLLRRKSSVEMIKKFVPRETFYVTIEIVPRGTINSLILLNNHLPKNAFVFFHRQYGRCIS